jgi:hypothetical protein
LGGNDPYKKHLGSVLKIDFKKDTVQAAQEDLDWKCYIDMLVFATLPNDVSFFFFKYERQDATEIEFSFKLRYV